MIDTGLICMAAACFISWVVGVYFGYRVGYSEAMRKWGP